MVTRAHTALRTLYAVLFWQMVDGGSWIDRRTDPSVKYSLSQNEFHHLKPISTLIDYYEPLFYDNAHMKDHIHRRKKRNSEGTQEHQPKAPIEFSFKAHQREFKIQLRQTPEQVFAPDLEIVEDDNKPVAYRISNVVSGHVDGDKNMVVQGILTSEGLFDGFIEGQNETYFIEPSNRYLDEAASRNYRNETFHSVIYKASDVKFPENATCASISAQGGVLQSYPISNSPRSKRDTSEHFATIVQDGDMLSFRQETFDMGNEQQNVNFRSVQRPSAMAWSPTNEPRMGKNIVVDPKKTTCMLYLQADHLFFDKMGKSREACIESMTRHVQKVNSIYKGTDFDQDGRPDNISFLIKRIKVHTMTGHRDYRYPDNYGVEKFLELFSEEDYDAFCLAYMFTYRDFEGGTLGLAWTGDLKNAGGVCEKNGHYRGSLKSLNTGIVTLLNYGKHVPPIVSHVTLAHEIGHSFGSPHDPKDDTVCTPGGEPGNYIMFAHATSGDKGNNNKFSPCSLRSINAVLNAKARNIKGCFSEPQSSICGNGVVEEAEECDCGWEDECKEACCVPMNDQRMHNDEPPCTLKKGVVCSPSQGPCCTQDCNLKLNGTCRDDNGCRSAASCDGVGPKCPPSVSKPNKTRCNEHFVCFMGECTGSICTAYGLESCQCEKRAGDKDTKSCELCCRMPGEGHECKSSFEWNTPPYDVPDLFAKPGTPCNQYNGYCDVFQMCREIDPSGPLATLRKLLLSTRTISSLTQILSHYAPLVVITAFFVFVLFLLVLRLFCLPTVAGHSSSLYYKQGLNSNDIGQGSICASGVLPPQPRPVLRTNQTVGKIIATAPPADGTANQSNGTTIYPQTCLLSSLGGSSATSKSATVTTKVVQKPSLEEAQPQGGTSTSFESNQTSIAGALKLKLSTLYGRAPRRWV